MIPSAHTLSASCSPQTVPSILLATSWLGRHARWVNEKMESNHLHERFFAKIWSVAFPLILRLSVIFIPQANKFQAFLRNRIAFNQPTDSLNQPPINLTIPISPPIPARPIYEEPTNFLDGNCDNFLREELFKPYLAQIDFILSQYPNLKANIDNLQESSFKNRVLEFYQHLKTPPENYSFATIRAYYQQFMFSIRECQKEMEVVELKADPAFALVQSFFDKFIQDYMKQTVFYEAGMNFLYSKGISRTLSIENMKDVPNALEQAFNQLKNNHCTGVVLGLYDPFQLGNIPYQSYELQTATKPVTVFRCSNVIRDEEKNGNTLVKAAVGEQFNLFLDAYQREGKKHLYVNLMRRCIPTDNESLRSDVIERLESRYPETLNVVSLDRDSSFYKQDGLYIWSNNVPTFKANFNNHFSNDHFYYWSNSLDKQQWKEQLNLIIEEVHANYFQSAETLDVGQRRAFIELVYCMIIDTLILRFEPDSCNFSCKNCIDRGGMTNAIMYIYYQLKVQGTIEPEQLNYLLYLTFLPAILVGNRQIQWPYLERLIQFTRTFLDGNTAFPKPLPENEHVKAILCSQEIKLINP